MSKCYNNHSYEVYIHIDGSLRIRKAIDLSYLFDKDISFIKLYLGIINAVNRKEAKKLLQNKIVGIDIIENL